jgi:hypothetical protein
MKHFEEKYHTSLTGSISGWDRLSFRGTIRWLSSPEGLGSYLSVNKILLKEFKPWAMGLTERIRQSSEALADIWGVRKVYLRSSSTNKEALAREIARKDGIETGPLCMLSVVEPCWSPWVQGNAKTRKLELTIRPRKCIWIYFYWMDEETGFGHLRLQSWLPFGIKGCLNGRHWLERQLMREKIAYIKADNCFRWIEDPLRAQRLMDEQLRTDWKELLEGRRKRCFGVLDELFGNAPMDYYWSADQTEWATDLMFRNRTELDRLFPVLARYGLLISDSANILRFLGKIDGDAALPARVAGDVGGDRRRRHEGVRVKHWSGHNSVKVYNKAGNVLRVETGINDPRSFRVFRKANDDPGRKDSWLPMRKGVADLHRRAQISQKSNERYLDALSACETSATLLEELETVCRRTQNEGRSVRALNPWSQLDLKLLRFLAQGQWALNGFRNRDLALWLEPNATRLDPQQRRRLTARVSRLLRLLRSHRLIRKVARTHRYVLTSRGQRIASSVVAASAAPTKELMKIAA